MNFKKQLKKRFFKNCLVTRKEKPLSGRPFEGALPSEPSSQLSVAHHSSVLNWFKTGLVCLFWLNCGQTLCAQGLCGDTWWLVFLFLIFPDVLQFQNNIFLITHIRCRGSWKSWLKIYTSSDNHSGTSLSVVAARLISPLLLALFLHSSAQNLNY